MNKEAARLGLKNTHFTNATGLPDKDHYASARDLAVLAAGIVRDHPQFFPLYSQKEYTYNGITQPNRNRLLWLDQYADGMKTGHTEAAGYCLVGTAKRGERRLISVVLGAASDNARITESQKLLNYGFQFFDTQKVYAKGQAVSTLALFKGAKDQVSAGIGDDIQITLPRDAFAKLKAQITTTQPLLAPLGKGQKVGTIKLTVDNAAVGEYPVVALEAVPVAGFFGRTWDTLRLMWKK